MTIREYDTWFEVWEDDGFDWQFVADFDTRDQADKYVAESESPLDCRVRKVRGQK